jgi:ATP-dependent RNA helicase DeaD
MGFRKLTPIQKEAMPLMLKGKDVIGQAQTGTGKTAAFGIPMLMRIDQDKTYPQGLVITPTRELAQQVTQRIRGYAKYTEIRVIVLHGGSKLSDQLNILTKPAHVVVGTPGRLLDLSRKRALILDNIKTVVLDEADKMLEMGFISSIDKLLSRTPFVRQTSLWSATLNDDVLSLAVRYMRHPRKVLVSKDEIAQLNVKQYVFFVKKSKLELLYRLLNHLEIDRGIIFLNTRESTDKLAQTLKAEGYIVESLHGGYSQNQREIIIHDFKLRRFHWLVSTDIASRGLDIRGIDYIINYEVPEDPEVYFHRIGRTARIGQTGVAYTLIGSEEASYWDRIIDMTESEPEKLNPSEIFK